MKLIDLSIARAPGEAPPGVGTWHYLSPEQARGARLGAAADVWGLGAVLFETATGEGPFDDDPDAWAELGDASTSGPEAVPDRYPQLERRARPPESVRPLPAGLAGLIADCLEPEPDLRPELDRVLVRLEALRRTAGVRASLEPRSIGEPVAHPADGLDRVLAELATQVADVDLDHVRAGVVVIAPDVCEQLLAARAPARRGS